ncbi:MAG: cytochrome c-type biogenesis protein CcmH [Hyphomicrobium sp.]|uniref:cytochrome c-type biogenesis protein n=1 Tax=Hyphomicrobium sp. TaxID=82 RepID=UPI003D12E0B6
MRLAPWLAALLLVIAATAPGRAVTPDEILPDAALEHRARSISAELRCLVCQNQSIDDSDAPLAHDLRVLVRERLKAGDSDQEVRDFVVARYGEFVLLRPPLSAGTLILWLTPLLALGLAAWIVWNAFGRARRQPTPATGSRLSPDEQAALDALLKNNDTSKN